MKLIPMQSDGEREQCKDGRTRHKDALTDYGVTNSCPLWLGEGGEQKALDRAVPLCWPASYYISLLLRMTLILFMHSLSPSSSLTRLLPFSSLTLQVYTNHNTILLLLLRVYVKEDSYLTYSTSGLAVLIIQSSAV